MAATKKIPTEKLSYEEAVAELEALVSQMEKGDLPLEASIEAYRRGMELTLACRKKLERAEEAIRKLDEEGKLTELKPEELRADSAKRADPAGAAELDAASLAPARGTVRRQKAAPEDAERYAVFPTDSDEMPF